MLSEQWNDRELLSSLATSSFALYAILRVVDDVYRQDFARLSMDAYSGDSSTFYLWKAWIHGRLQQPQAEQAYYDSAVQVIDHAVPNIRQLDPTGGSQGGVAVYHSQLGLAYAGLGHFDDAIREAKLGSSQMPLSKDALTGTFRLADLALVYTMADQAEAAIEVLDSLLSVPSQLSTHKLRLDPVWEPLRDHPRFQALLDKYE